METGDKILLEVIVDSMVKVTVLYRTSYAILYME